MLRAAIICSALLLCACRPQGLSELPEDRDPANALAPSSRPASRPALDESAFDGVELNKGGHHHGHGGHAGQNKEAPPEAEVAPEGGHAGHGGGQ